MKGSLQLPRHAQQGRQRSHKPAMPRAELLCIDSERISPDLQVSVTLEELLELRAEVQEDLPEEVPEELVWETPEDFKEYVTNDFRSPRIQRLVIGELEPEVNEKQPIVMLSDDRVFPNFHYPAKATVFDRKAQRSNLWKDMRDERKRLSTRHLIKSFDKSSNRPADGDYEDEAVELPELLHYDSPRFLEERTPTVRFLEGGQAASQAHNQSSLPDLHDSHSRGHAPQLSRRKAVSLPHPPIRKREDSSLKQDINVEFLKSLAAINTEKHTDDISSRRPMRVQFQDSAETKKSHQPHHAAVSCSARRQVRVPHQQPLPGKANASPLQHHAAIANALASKHKWGVDSKPHVAAQLPPASLRSRIRDEKPRGIALESPRKSPKADEEGEERRQQIQGMLKKRLLRQTKFKWKPARPTTQSLLRPPSVALGHKVLCLHLPRHDP